MFHCALDYFCSRQTEKIPIKVYYTSTGRFHHCRLSQFAKSQSFFTIRCKDVFIITIFRAVFIKDICFSCNICIGSNWCCLCKLRYSTILIVDIKHNYLLMVAFSQIQDQCKMILNLHVNAKENVSVIIMLLLLIQRYKIFYSLQFNLSA